jgi:putative ABC transport system permease protein
MPRLLRRQRHTFVAGLLLAVGISAAASVLSVRRALSPLGLPYPGADRLVVLQAGGRSWSPGMLQALTSTTTAFDAVTGIQERAASLTGVDAAEVIRIESVSADYFRMLGVNPAVGRVFTREEDRRGSSVPVAVMSDALWQRRFARNPAVLGTSISIDGKTLEVIGIMSVEFGGLIGRTDVWVPLGSARWLSGDTAPERPTSRWFEVLARVRGELSIDQAQGKYATEARTAISQIAGGDRIVTATTRFELIPLSDARVPAVVQQTTRVLAIAVGVLLALVIVNVIGLHLVRTDERERELAIRLAIGATLRQIGGLAVREAALIAAAGAVGALALRPVLLTLLAAIQPRSTGFGIVTSTVLTAEAVKTDLPTVLAIIALAGVAALPLALCVVVKSRALLAKVPRHAGRRWSGLPGSMNARTILVALQATLACAIVCCGALLTRSSTALLARNRGYTPSGVLMARLELPAEYDSQKAARFYAQVIHHLTSTAGIASASVSNCTPGAGRCRQTNVNRVDDRALDPSVQPTIGLHYVTPSHFATLGAQMRRGRMFTDSDVAGAPNVVVITESLAERLWPGASPIGRTLDVFTANGSLNGSRSVIGTVSAISFDVESDRGLDVFLPAAQGAWTTAVLFVRGAASRVELAHRLSETVRSVDRAVPVYDVGGLETPLLQSLKAEAFLRRMLLAFGATGLLLAALGTYAIVSQAVGRTERELGIRAALGATPGQIGSLVARRAALVAVVAVSVGVLAAVWVGGLLRPFLHGLAITDPIAVAAGPVLTIVAIAAAVLHPAVRAARAPFPFAALEQDRH